ncbi:hypothetical protein ACLQ24_00305 [Micromonospora sp. DT4]|uniref:hypothetical protein n=1 Tax=Micromonospora sp. DT4 TaxID=3393438 RepID=UPI003CF795A4
MARPVNPSNPGQSDHRRLLLWADIYRMPSGSFGGWQPPDLVSDRDHPFPRQMAPVRQRWRDRIRGQIRRWRGRNDEGAAR